MILFRSSSASPRRGWRALWLCALAAAAGLASAQPQAWQGLTLVEIIESLRADGLQIVYSSELVDPSYRAESPPSSNEPIPALTELLGRFDLGLQRGPRGSWLIVRGASAPAPANAREATAPRARPAPPDIELVVVQASRYAFTRSTAPSAYQVDREQLDNAPTLGQDALRTLHSLPGFTSSGLTARTNVRGGESNEALILLDGVRLRSPFHLKNFQSLFSSLSPAIVDHIEVSAGGFSPRHGNRMSGVIDLRSIEPSERRHHEIGVSTLTTSVLSTGRFGEEESGSWVTSLRRGNLDLLIDAASSDVGQPQYTDFFNKITLGVGEASTLSIGTLTLDDKITLNDAGDRAGADYHDSYLWLTLESGADARLGSRYTAALTDLATDRNGRVDIPNVVTGSLDERQRFQDISIDAEWSLELAGTRWLNWGLEAHRQDATYRFLSDRAVPFPIDTGDLVQPADIRNTLLSLDDRRLGAFATYRFRPIERLTAELGIRWDRQSEQRATQTSPRLSMMLEVGSASTLRASWGRFHQPQGIDELQVGDGLGALFPAQEAEHYVLSFEHMLQSGLWIRLEAYRKEFEKLRPRFENLFARVTLVPELLPDRAMIAPSIGEASGVELSLNANLTDWQWWVNLTRAAVTDRIGGRDARRSWEERWSVKAGAIWHGDRWTVSASGTVHSGWPITELTLSGTTLSADAYNGRQLESFRTLDLRASRSFALDHGSIEAFAEITNVLNRENPCCYDYRLALDGQGRPAALDLDTDYWLRAIPSFGFLWRF